MGSNARSVSWLQTKTGCLSLLGGVLFIGNQTNQSTFTDSVPWFSGLYKVSWVLWAAVGDVHSPRWPWAGVAWWFLSFGPIPPTEVVWVPTSFNPDSWVPVSAPNQASSAIALLWAHPWPQVSHLAVSGNHPVPSSPNRKTLLLPPSVIGWGSILLRPTMKVLPGSSCLKHFPYGPIPLECSATPCSSGLSDIALSRRWQSHTSIPFTTPAACSAFKIQIICSQSIRRVWAQRQARQLPASLTSSCYYITLKLGPRRPLMSVW